MALVCLWELREEGTNEKGRYRENHKKNSITILPEKSKFVWKNFRSLRFKFKSLLPLVGWGDNV